MDTSHVTAAHVVLAEHTHEEVRAEAARLSAVVKEASRQCEMLPTEGSRTALRAALDAAWPYTHAVGMLKQLGR